MTMQPPNARPPAPPAVDMREKPPAPEPPAPVMTGWGQSNMGDFGGDEFATGKNMDMGLSTISDRGKKNKLVDMDAQTNKPLRGQRGLEGGVVGGGMLSPSEEIDINMGRTPGMGAPPSPPRAFSEQDRLGEERGRLNMGVAPPPEFQDSELGAPPPESIMQDGAYPSRAAARKPWRRSAH